MSLAGLNFYNHVGSSSEANSNLKKLQNFSFLFSRKIYNFNKRECSCVNTACRQENGPSILHPSLVKVSKMPSYVFFCLTLTLKKNMPNGYDNCFLGELVIIVEEGN